MTRKKGKPPKKGQADKTIKPEKRDKGDLGAPRSSIGKPGGDSAGSDSGDAQNGDNSSLTHENPYLVAYHLYQAGLFPQAILKFDEVLASNDGGDYHKDHNFALFYKACSLLNMGKGKESIHLFEETLRRDSDNKAFINGLGVAWLYMGELDKAADYFTRALEVDPDYFEASYHLAKVFQRQKKFDKSVEQLVQCLRIVPDSYLLLKEISTLKAFQGKISESLAYFRRYMQAVPEDPDNFFVLALLYKKDGKFDQALECLERWPSAGPKRAKYLLEKMELYLHLNLPNDFQNLSRVYCKEFPKGLIHLNAHLSISKKLGQFELMRSLSELMLKSRQYDIKTLNHLFEMLIIDDAAPDKRLELSHFAETYLKTNPRASVTDVAYYWYLLGRQKEYFRNPLEAKKLYKSSLTKLEDFLPSLFYLGWNYFFEGEIVKARDYFDKASEKNYILRFPVFHTIRCQANFALSMVARLLGDKSESDYHWKRAEEALGDEKRLLYLEELNLDIQLGKSPQVESHWRQASADFPRDCEILARAAVGQFLAGNESEADKLIKRALQSGKMATFKYLVKLKRENQTLHEDFHRFLDTIHSTKRPKASAAKKADKTGTTKRARKNKSLPKKK